jgi:cell division transport system permease protein
VSSLVYSFQEALISLRRAGRSAAMSIGTIAIAFLTLGSFLLISTNLQSVMERWASAAELSVYLRDDVDEASRQALIAELSGNGEVSGVEFVSKDAALERFKSDFPELGDVTAAHENPFPAALEVRLRSDATSAAAAEQLAAGLKARPGIADVRYDRQWLTRLLGVLTAIRIAGFVVAGVLVLGAAFTVAAVVRLSLEARHEEIDIMQLVGAPFSFVRGPFVAEGTLLGGLGATLSLVILWGLFVTLRGRLYEMVAGFASIGELRFLGLTDGTLLLIAGFAVGALAGIAASRAAH